MQKDEKLAYLAGWYAADGFLQTDPNAGRHLCFYLAARDAFILELFSSWFGGRVRYYDYSRNGRSYPVVKWVSWRSDLYEFLLTGDFKQHIWPENSDLQCIFLRGFLEGDGHVGFRNKNGHFRLTFTNASVSLLEDIMSHLSQYLNIPTKTLKLRRDNTHQISYEAREARLIAWYLYREAEYFLPRKGQVVQQLFGDILDPVAAYFQILSNQPPEFIARNNGLFFRLSQAKNTLQAVKSVCAGFKLLGIDAIPVPDGKGKNKQHGIYIPQKHLHQLAYTQDMLIKKVA